MTSPRGISRRAVLIGGAGVVAAGTATAFGIEAGVLPGRTTLHLLLGLNGEPGAVPAAEPGPKVSGQFVSAARQGTTVKWTISYPPGATAGKVLPVVVVLHGHGCSHKTTFTQLKLDRFQAAARSPFAIATVDGGNGYYHRRGSGDDSGAMVVDEFLPLLAEQGLDTTRLGFMGWSMGGYGSLLLGSQLGPDRVAAIVAESPAMWIDGAHSPDGAFDDGDDYAAHDLAGRQRELDGIPIRIDCGTGDGFYPVVRDYAAGFATPPEGAFEPGGHDYDYWRRIAPDFLSFLARYVK